MIKKVYICDICKKQSNYPEDGWVSARTWMSVMDWGWQRIKADICPQCKNVIKKMVSGGNSCLKKTR